MAGSRPAKPPKVSLKSRHNGVRGSGARMTQSELSILSFKVQKLILDGGSNESMPLHQSFCEHVRN
jgi:hypothetical protein